MVMKDLTVAKLAILTLELRMLHNCDVHRHALSAAVAFMQQSS